VNHPTTQHKSELERYASLLEEARAIKGVSLGKDAWRRLRTNRVAMFSLWLLGLFGLLALLTPLVPLQPPRLVDTARQFAAPRMTAAARLFAGHRDGPEALPQRTAEAVIQEGFGQLDPFSRGLLSARLAIFGDRSIPSVCGTDKLGRDVLARLFWGSRISLAVGLVATLVSLVIGVSYGAVSGYLGGWVDNLMMRVVDVLYSIPFIFVVIFLITILSAEGIKERLEKDFGINRMVVFFFLVGAIYWLTMARVVRGQVISLKNEQFIEAARTLGASRFRIIFVHLVPNLLSVVIVYLTLTIPRVMLFEAFLSFLGLGVEPPDVSWGLLANEGIQAITPIRIYWWLVVFPGLALGLTLFALNFLGDGLRDALDPRLKNR
jgi:oligopeptide transport system permease protein